MLSWATYTFKDALTITNNEFCVCDNTNGQLMYPVLLVGKLPVK